MTRGSVLFAVIVLLVGGGIDRPALPDDPAITFTGEVRIMTAPDGKTTAVTIDAGDQTFFPDGVVDHAFRLQHQSFQALEYDGPATIRYMKGQLTVRPIDGEAWVFVVADAAGIAATATASKGAIMVIGLSHHWGKAIHRSPAEVTAGLLSSSCSMAGGDPSCEKCEAGGSGAEGCAIDCGGGSDCSVSCGAGSVACCSCANGCRCCPSREAEAAKGVSR